MTEKKNGPAQEQKTLVPEYVPPKITTYTSEEIIEKIGPAQACISSPCSIN